MINLARIGILFFCIVLFSGIICFAQHNDLQNISTSESSKMFKGSNGLISSSEMQTYQEGKTSEMVRGSTGGISRRWKTIKRTGSSKPNTQVTGN